MTRSRGASAVHISREKETSARQESSRKCAREGRSARQQEVYSSNSELWLSRGWCQQVDAALDTPRGRAGAAHQRAQAAGGGGAHTCTTTWHLPLHSQLTYTVQTACCCGFTALILYTVNQEEKKKNSDFVDWGSVETLCAYNILPVVDSSCASVWKNTVVLENL